MSNKITKKDNFKAIIEVLAKNGKEDLVAVMQHEIELIEKKASNAKMTKTQEANQDIKALILQVLEGLDTPLSITEILAESPELAKATGNSNQKLSALMTQLKNEGKVVRTQDKKKALFSIAE